MQILINKKYVGYFVLIKTTFFHLCLLSCDQTCSRVDLYHATCIMFIVLNFMNDAIFPLQFFYVFFKKPFHVLNWEQFKKKIPCMPNNPVSLYLYIVHIVYVLFMFFIEYCILLALISFIRQVSQLYKRCSSLLCNNRRPILKKKKKN